MQGPLTPCEHSLISTWQKVPVYPAAQSQAKPESVLGAFLQVAPFWQGAAAHVSSTFWQRTPLKPEGQTHVVPLLTHWPPFMQGWRRQSSTGTQGEPLTGLPGKKRNIE